ncbi:hypothetical protein [Mesorhizobium sp.]|uniref:hypothetical protein n=1 Tax=Mesorhizobium sp. TaxID=1871066 RepID=UPI00257C2BA1|nr:hypothetical protein [Mesorhizobium sp.]
MSETDKSYWLLSETSGIGETRDRRLDRGLPLFEGLALCGLAGFLDPARVEPGLWECRFSCPSPSFGRLSDSVVTTFCFRRLPGS